MAAMLIGYACCSIDKQALVACRAGDTLVVTQS